MNVSQSALPQATLTLAFDVYLDADTETILTAGTKLQAYNGYSNEGFKRVWVDGNLHEYTNASFIELR
ncbi:hypothetical protein ANABIO32_00350 [Rossellomorea marisflavi]|nr:hypothetical protein ANABIO32_00350 [Rossellomorea marisflavi]